MHIDMDELMEVIESDNCTGFCTACGSSQSGVEPDAHGYECEACGAHKVTGAEDLLLECC